MEPIEPDKQVPTEIHSLLSEKRLILRETQRAVTPFGGVAVFLANLRKIDLAGKIRQQMAVQAPSDILSTCKTPRVVWLLPKSF